MTTAAATLAGHRATYARVTVPAWGRWYADATIDGDVDLAGRVTLVVADLTLQGTVLSGGSTTPKNGRSNYRIVAGAGGWGKPIPAKFYRTDAGVKLVTVLNDAASAVGEKMDPATVSISETVGTAWVREKVTAARVLELLKPGAWYVGEDGVTRLGARKSTPFTGIATRVMSDRATGTITLAAQSIAALVPGAVVDGVEAIDVEHEASADGGLRTTIWGAPGGVGVAGSDRSRRLAAHRKLLDQLDPARRFRAPAEFRVVEQIGSRLNLQPVRVSSGLPNLTQVIVRPGLAGADAQLLPGSRVIVQFIDASPARPIVTAFEDAAGAGFLPIEQHINATLLKLGPVGARPIAAAGDLAGGIWPVVPTQAAVLV